MTTPSTSSPDRAADGTTPLPAPKKLASRLAVIAPLSLIFMAVVDLSFTTNKVQPSDRDSSVQDTLLLGTVVILVITGFIATFFALRSVSRHGRRGSPVWTVTGLLLNVMLLLVLTGNVPRGLFERRSSPEKEAAERSLAVKKAVADMANVMERLDRTLASQTNFLSPEARLEFISTELARATRDSTGFPRLILGANAAFTRRMFEETDQFLKSTKAFTTAQVFLPASNDTLQKIQHNRQLTQSYLEHNHSFSNFMSRALENYQADLKTYGVPEVLVRQQVESFAAGFTWDPRLGELRAGDGRIGTACLGVLDIFERNLGKWTNISPNIVTFPVDADSENYVKLMQEMNSASLSQREIKRQRQSGQ